MKLANGYRLRHAARLIAVFFVFLTLTMKRTRKLEFVLDDSSLSTPQELEGVKGTWITFNKDGETQQIFIPKLDYVCPCCKRPKL